jgi:hypothetical protein
MEDGIGSKLKKKKIYDNVEFRKQEGAARPKDRRGIIHKIV